MGDAKRRRKADPYFGQQLVYTIRIWEAHYSHTAYSPYLEIPYAISRLGTYRQTQIKASAVAGTIMGYLSECYKPGQESEIQKALGADWMRLLAEARAELPSEYYALVAMPICYETQYLGADIRDCGTPTVYASSQKAIPSWAAEQEFDWFDMRSYLEAV